MRSYYFIGATEYIRENEEGILQDFAPYTLKEKVVETNTNSHFLGL
jgi:hypothetical protein